MGKNRTIALLAVCGLLFLNGCGNEALKQAQQDLEQENYEYALEGYQEAISQGEDLAEAYRGAGVSALKLGQYENAVEYLGEAFAQEKTSDSFQKDVLSYKITAEYKLGQYEEALSDCQSLMNYSADADTYYLAGRVNLAVDAYEEAQANFEKACEKDGSSQMAIQIYEAYKEKEMEADGSRYLEQALEKEENSYQKGQLYYYMEDYENAEEQLQKAVDQKETEAACLLGQVYLEKGDTAGAREMFQQYLDMEGTRAKGYNGLVLCDIKEENYEEALKNIEAGLEDAETEDMKLLMFNEVVVYEKMSDFATAKEKADKYTEWFPDDEEMRKEQTFLASRIG